MATATKRSKTAATDLRAAGAPGQAPATRHEAHAVGAAIMGETGRRPDAVANRETPRAGVYWAKRTFDYMGKSYDRGQLLRFAGGKNDALMKDLGYVGALEPGTATYACSKCGAEFVDMGLRDGHGKARHQPRVFAPPPPPQWDPEEESREMFQNRLDEWARTAGAMADASEETRDRHEDEVAPLDLTKTAASREA